MLGELALEGIFGQDRLDGSIPKDLARIAVETNHVPPQVRFLALVIRVGAVAGPTGYHDTMTDYDRAGRSGPRQLGLPLQVLGFAPGDWKRPLVEAHAASLRAVESRPIAGACQIAENKNRQPQGQTQGLPCTKVFLHDDLSRPVGWALARLL